MKDLMMLAIQIIEEISLHNIINIPGRIDKLLFQPPLLFRGWGEIHSRVFLYIHHPFSHFGIYQLP
jgi:hypothetical protein